MKQILRFLVGGGVVLLFLGCPCGAKPDPGGLKSEPSLCSAEGILNGIQETDGKVSSVSQFGCKHDHALVRAQYDCEGCVPESMFFLAEKTEKWEVIGNSTSFDAGLCEESRALSFDNCTELFATFEAAAK
jgi:hypothetical protein